MFAVCEDTVEEVFQLRESEVRCVCDMAHYLRTLERGVYVKYCLRFQEIRLLLSCP